MIKRWITQLILGAFCAVTASLAVADVLQLKQDYPDRYVVQKGDTLWDISARFLQNPWQWPQIWDYNQQIKNPHLIFPGDELSLVWVDGKPQLVVNRGKSASTIKLSPYVRKTPVDNAITTISLDTVRPFLEIYRFISKDDLKESPYILSGAEGSLLMGKGSKLYSRGDLEEGVSLYGVYREGKEYKHPRTKEKLGIQMRNIGTVRLTSEKEGIGTFYTERAASGFMKGDILLPADEDGVAAFFQPRPVRRDMEAKIMEAVSGVKNVGRYDVIMIDVGTEDGVDVGSVFGAYKSGGVVEDPRKGKKIALPDEVAGNIMVFKALETISYGLVMTASRPLSVGDTLGAP